LPFEKHGVRGDLTSEALRTFDRAAVSEPGQKPYEELFRFQLGERAFLAANPLEVSEETPEFWSPLGRCQRVDGGLDC
jgi:hypothetical protein